MACSMAQTVGLIALPTMFNNISFNMSNKSSKLVSNKQNMMSIIFCRALDTIGFCGSGTMSACNFLNIFDRSFVILSLILLIIFFIAALINLVNLLTILFMSPIRLLAASIYTPANSVNEFTVVRKLPNFVAMSAMGSLPQPSSLV